jgi:DNA repair exonuclease SbcCD nuclease subunit
MHTSDLHLGDESLPCNRREGFDLCLCPLLIIRAAARQWRPDVIVLAGDVFDNPRVGDKLVRRAWDVLQEFPVPVLISPGNHDALTDGNVYERLPPKTHDDLLHIVRNPDGELVSLLDGALSVWARPTIEHEPWYRPLHGAPPRPKEGWYVAVAHGDFVGGRIRESVTHHASPITIEDIAETNADYVALGHWERAKCVSESPILTWYSGVPLSHRGSGLLGVTFDVGVTVEHIKASVAHECQP